MIVQHTGWSRVVLLLVLLILSGCGPPKGERTMDRANEQQAVDAYNRGVAYYARGELDEAIASYTEAVRLNPKLADAYLNRGAAYDAKGELDEAIADFTQALRLNPKDAEAHNNRGVAYKSKGDLDKAIAD